MSQNRFQIVGNITSYILEFEVPKAVFHFKFVQSYFLVFYSGKNDLTLENRFNQALHLVSKILQEHVQKKYLKFVRLE